MKKNILTTLLLITTSFAAKITDSGTVIVPGCYTTFSAFQTNSPSITDSTFTLQTVSRESLPDDSTMTLLHQKRGKLRTFGENIWGYSDGKDVYVALIGGAVSTPRFRKLTIREFYSYYSEPYSVPAMVSGGSINEPDLLVMNPILIDMKSGRKSPMTKPAMRELLRKEDTGLYQQFLADSDASEKVIDYLEALNRTLAEKRSGK